jgi:DnaJ-class molecular chaperone
MGDLADDFRKIRKSQGWECLDCGGSGIYVDPITDDLQNCETCGGDGIKPGHELKEEL